MVGGARETGRGGGAVMSLKRVECLFVCVPLLARVKVSISGSF